MKTEKLGQEPAFPAEPIDVVMGQVAYNYIDENGLEQINRSNQYGKQLQHGMSKRFYAACAAMQGLVANSDYMERMAEWEKSKETSTVVKDAYELADELLRQEEE